MAPLVSRLFPSGCLRVDAMIREMAAGSHDLFAELEILDTLVVDRPPRSSIDLKKRMHGHELIVRAPETRLI